MEQKKTKKVAVIAVHGVADQKPNKSARDIADLLLGSGTAADYSTFTEEDLRIALRSVEVAERVSIEKAGLWNFEQQPNTLTYLQRKQSVPHESVPTLERESADVESEDYGDEALEHDVMREQIQNYEPEETEATLETVMLRGTRSAGGERCQVDLYEMYWADLSRLKNGLLSIFFEFYLLLFFISRLGGIALERVRCHFSGAPHWRRAVQAHWVGEIALALAVPILILCLLSLTIAAVIYFLPHDPAMRQVIYALPTGILAAVVAVLVLALYNYRHQQSARYWTPLYFLVLAAAIAGFLVALEANPGGRGFIFQLWLIVAALLAWLFWNYNSHRSGAFAMGGCFLLGTGLIFGSALFFRTTSNGHEAVFEAMYWSVQIVSWITTGAWVVFIFAAIFLTAFGAIAVMRTQQADQPIAGRSVWTANLSLVLPGILVLIVNIGLLQLLLFFADRFDKIPDEHIITVQSFLDTTILRGFTTGIMILGAAMLLAVWAVLPAVLGEIVRQDKWSFKADWLGRSLSEGFKWMRLSGEVFRWMLIVGIPLSFFVPWMFSWPGLEADRRAILIVGIGSFIVIAGSKGPFRFLALGFRAALDIALDVANWLRTRPGNRTPRAAICSRYISLLHHIANWQDLEDGGGYDAVVIIAHSQGTVISVDLLRFLNREYAGVAPMLDKPLGRLFDPKADEPLPVSLFTMGSPLRQLYNQRFPIQYGWAGYDLSGSGSQGPQVGSLNVTRWSNAYRSGDYVGRHLWYADDHPDIWEEKWTDHDSQRREACIGPGAHTHYWDGTAPEVAGELDRLIGAACK